MRGNASSAAAPAARCRRADVALGKNERDDQLEFRSADWREADASALITAIGDPKPTSGEKVVCGETLGYPIIR